MNLITLRIWTGLASLFAAIVSNRSLQLSKWNRQLRILKLVATTDLLLTDEKLVEQTWLA